MLFQRLIAQPKSGPILNSHRQGTQSREKQRLREWRSRSVSQGAHQVRARTCIRLPGLQTEYAIFIGTLRISPSGQFARKERF
jgi:hypothetical protein